MNSKFIFFWSDKDEDTGFLSQWYRCNKIDYCHDGYFTADGLEYNCAEQYMMAQKALLFKDGKSFNKIMKEKNPKEQQKLGRLVSNYNEDIWNENKYKIVRMGNILKFSQHTELRKKLIDLRSKCDSLVEASPYDKIWGIGLKKDDPRALSMKDWNGQNLLGKILTELPF